MTPSFLASRLMQSSDSPIRRMAPQTAYVLYAPVMRPVDSSTSAKLSWIDAWSLAAMIRLLAELKTEKDADKHRGEIIQGLVDNGRYSVRLNRPQNIATGNTRTV